MNTAVRKLLGANIISSEQHTEILSKRDRGLQRQQIFDILISKPDNGWEQPFKRILEETNQIYLISGSTG